MDREIFNQLPKFKQIGGVLRAPQTSTKELFVKIVSNINLKSLTILEKSFTLDAWPDPEFPSAGGWNTVPKIQTKIWQQVKMVTF